MRTDATNPYVGLRPFEIDESILFFGRNDQTLELLQRLHQHHFVAVVGSSGCGKSSLLRAGLIPALKAGYLVEDSNHWIIAIMKPGQSPLYNLAEAILQQIDPASNAADFSLLAEKINEQGTDAILNLITPLRKENNVNFFLLVDQFEELFRFAMNQKNVAGNDEAIDFVNIMLQLSQQSSIPFYAVLTMRSDFIGDCDQFYGLPEAMNKSQYLVPRLNRIQLKMVIEGPAKLFGGKINPSLTSRLINELGKVKDELPLLQHALMRIWDFEMNVNKSGELDPEDYKNIGGIENALSKHADEALTGMSDEEYRVTKKIFKALTAIDENGRKIRRPVLLSRLKEITGATEEQLLNIIDLFIKDRRSFLIINKAGDTRDKIIDISHESLIRQWNTLSRWVDEEGEDAANYKRLAEYAELKQQKQKDFLDGSELQIALAWYNRFKPEAAWADRYKEDGFQKSIDYLADSEKEFNAKQLQAKERKKLEEERQIQEFDRERQDKARKQKQRFLIFGIVVLSIFVIGAGLATYSYINKNSEIRKLLARAKASEEKANIEKENAKKTLENLQAASNSINSAIAGSTGEEKKKLEYIQKKLLAVGNNYRGGIIFSIRGSGENGLIVAEEDLKGRFTWDEAIQERDRLNAEGYNGYNDWRLPTQNELWLIWDSQNANFNGADYWSSQESTPTRALHLNFNGGGYKGNTSKGERFSVHLVREF
jgi:energy-coupling factor transporter ATP-binding protein EcfA2/phage anti-repressor protein